MAVVAGAAGSRVGIHDNFFELGGDSILGLQIVARARDLGMNFTVQQLFEHQTVAALAAEVTVALTPVGAPAPPAPVEPAIVEPAPAAAVPAPRTEFPMANLPREAVNALLAGRTLDDLFPLAPIQEGILFHSLEAPASGVYFEQVVLAHGPELDIDALESAWRRAVERHPSLRTSFHWDGLAHPVQAVHQIVALPIVRHDWSTVPQNELTARMEAFLAEDRRRGFDLNEAPLMRLAFVRTASGWQLVWSFHHLVLDGWSVSVLLREIQADLAGGAVAPAPPYREFVAWMGRKDFAEAEQFWRTQLRRVAGPTPLVVDTPTEVAPDEVYDCDEIELDMVKTARLRTFCRRERLTLSTVAHGAWALLLSRYSGEEDVLFGSTVAGRPSDLAGAERMVGCFINTLPLRVPVPQGLNVIGWLGDLQARQMALHKFESTPLVRVREWSGLGGDVPLFETVVLFQNQALEMASGEREAGWRRAGVRVHERTNYPLVAEFIPGAGRLTLRLTYDRRRLRPDAAARMLGHVETLLTAIASGGDRPLGGLPLLEDRERRQLLGEWNDTARAYDAGMTVHAMIDAQAERTPDAVAVVFETMPSSPTASSTCARTRSRAACKPSGWPRARWSASPWTGRSSWCRRCSAC